jgi:rod shape-determining protein MreD
VIGFARMGALFAAAMAFHWWWTTHFSFFGLSPQILLVLTVAVAARSGPIRAMCLGFAWGLFLDFLNARLFGANALALTLVGYGAGSVRRQIDVAGLAPQCAIVGLMTWAYFLLLGLLGAVFMRHFLWVGWTAFLFDPFYNVLAAAAAAAVWEVRRAR